MKHKVHRRILFYLLVIIRAILRYIPRYIGLRTGEFLGFIAFYVLVKDRKKTIRNLQKAFGREWSKARAERIALDVFMNMGKTFVEIITMEYRLKKIFKKIRVQNFDIIEKILSENKKIIVLGGHFGNWELLAAYVAARYQKMGGTQGGVIGRRIRYDKYNQLLVSMRESYLIKTFYRDESMKPVLKLLKDNAIIGVVPDQDVDSIKGIFVPFFGLDAYTPVGPAYLSMISKTPLVPACMVWQKDSYLLKVGSAIYPDSVQKEEAVLEITRQWSNALELFIREYPEQWVWFHDRWKTKKSKDQ